jgi:IS30 family transposase
MARRYKKFSPLEVEAMWARWQQSEALIEIGEALGHPKTTILWRIEQAGGLRPRGRRRSARALSLVDREEISRGVAAGESVRAIARRIGRAPSTVSRELRRHAPTPTAYRASRADEAAWDHARRPKPCRLAQHRRLRQLVEQKLRIDWAPQQIAQWLKATYPDDPTLHVSHETIYQSLYVQARGALKRALVAHLRRGQRYRRPGRDRRRPGSDRRPVS